MQNLTTIVQQLKAMSKKLSTKVEAQAKGPFTLKYVGSSETIEKMQQQLASEDQKPAGFGPADEFISDLENILRQPCPSLQDCVETLGYFCEAYPVFTLNDFRVCDSMGKTAAIPQLGEQQQLSFTGVS